MKVLSNFSFQAYCKVSYREIPLVFYLVFNWKQMAYIHYFNFNYFFIIIITWFEKLETLCTCSLKSFSD